MPTKYGFETEDDKKERGKERKYLEEQQKLKWHGIETRIDPIIQDIFNDYLASAAFKEGFGFDIDIGPGPYSIAFHENMLPYYYHNENTCYMSRWWISLFNEKNVKADPYHWGEINPWKLQLEIKVDLQFTQDDEASIQVLGAYLTFYGIAGTRSYGNKGYDGIELPQREQLDRQIHKHTGIAVTPFHFLN